MKYLLKNGTVVSGEKSEKLDVLVDGEKIVNVGKDLEAGDAEVIDVEGKLLFPGFIDGHTHFDLEVAGTVTADDFETGTRAALLGGTTLVIDYASQDKGGHTLKEGLDKWHKKADGKCSCDLHGKRRRDDRKRQVCGKMPGIVRQSTFHRRSRRCNGSSPCIFLGQKTR